MEVSVVVPTLNGRTQLARCLDALSEHAPGVEVVVVNGPSTDGTTGMVREREDVDVLVEIADRNLNVARNAGIEHARGEWIAFVSDEYSIDSGWFDALRDATGTDTAEDGDSRLLGALSDRLGSVRTVATEGARAVTDRSKRLASRARTSTNDPAEAPSAGDDPLDGASADDTSTDDTSTDDTSVGDRVPTDDAPDDAAVEDVPTGHRVPADATVNRSENIGNADPAVRAERNDEDGPSAEFSSLHRDERTDELPEVITGPIHRELVGGTTTQSPESRIVAGRSVTYFNPDNVVFRRDALDAADGFDESLSVGGARDLAHRLAAGEYTVAWDGRLCVRGEYGADGTGRDPRWDARSLSYRLVKNYGLRPAVLGRVSEHVAGDGLSGTRSAIRGDLTLSGWFGTARDVTVGVVLGTAAGLRARWGDRGRYNPNGLSARTDRAVEVYDRR